MQIRVLTLRYNDNLQGFPEDALREALSGHELLDVREYFFVHGNVPHMAFVLLLSDMDSGPSRRIPAEDPGKQLPEHLRKLYRDLRQWRNERAKKDGVPSYVIMRNALVAEICRRLPETLAQLKEIEGVGEATCAKYGRDILGMIPAELRESNRSGDAPPDMNDKESEESSKNEAGK